VKRAPSAAQIARRIGGAVLRVKQKRNKNSQYFQEDKHSILQLRDRANSDNPFPFPKSLRKGVAMVRDDIKAALITAMKAKEERTVSTLRMAQSEIKNKDIEARVGGAPADDDAMVVDVLMKMVKKRRDSIEMYEKGSREDLAEIERAEIAILERFLPKLMSTDEATAAIQGLVAELGATSVKDMGKVMAALKARYTGQIDMGAANALVKAALNG
jgi:uncharacterized protein